MKGWLFFAVLSFSITAAIALKMEDSNELLKYPSMLEISTRPWLYSLSVQYAKNFTRLRDIPLQEFQAIKQKGFQVVWMMGVWELGMLFGLQENERQFSVAF